MKDVTKQGNTFYIIVNANANTDTQIYTAYWDSGGFTPIYKATITNAKEAYQADTLELYNNSLFLLASDPATSNTTIWRSNDDAATWQKVFTFWAGPLTIKATAVNGIYIMTRYSNINNYILHSWDGYSWSISSESTNPFNSYFNLEVAVSPQHVSFFTHASNISKLECNAWPIPVIASKTITANTGDNVVMNASASYDLENDLVLPAWGQTSGPTTTLTQNGLSASFTPQQAGTYVFQLTLNDAGSPVIPVGSTDTVTVTVNAPASNASNASQNHAPIVSAGGSKTCQVNAPCVLQGTATDQDGDTLSITWSKASSSAGYFASASTLATVFIAQELGTHIASLTVNDGKGGVASD